MLRLHQIESRLWVGSSSAGGQVRRRREDVTELNSRSNKIFFFSFSLSLCRHSKLTKTVKISSQPTPLSALHHSHMCPYLKLQPTCFNEGKKKERKGPSFLDKRRRPKFQFLCPLNSWSNAFGMSPSRAWEKKSVIDFQTLPRHKEVSNKVCIRKVNR